MTVGSGAREAPRAWRLLRRDRADPERSSHGDGDRAVSGCSLDVLDKDSFVTVVTGHSQSASALDELVQRRLEEAKIVS